VALRWRRVWALSCPVSVPSHNTLLAGALTLALSHINKVSLGLSNAKSEGPSSKARGGRRDRPVGCGGGALYARVLVPSVSDSALSQYAFDEVRIFDEFVVYEEKLVTPTYGWHRLLCR